MPQKVRREVLTIHGKILPKRSVSREQEEILDQQAAFAFCGITASSVHVDADEPVDPTEALGLLTAEEVRELNRGLTCPCWFEQAIEKEENPHKHEDGSNLSLRHELWVLRDKSEV